MLEGRKEGRKGKQFIIFLSTIAEVSSSKSFVFGAYRCNKYGPKRLQGPRAPPVCERI